MSIKVQCPACRSKLNARDDLAGNRVKCPACGRPVLVPAMQPVATVQLSRSAARQLLDAAAEEDADQVAALLPQVDFTIVESPDESEGEDKAALVAEVEGAPAIVAFTSNEHAQAFAESASELLDDDGSLPAFIVPGANLLENLPEDFGLLLNPESEECVVLAPAFVDQLRNVDARAGAPGPEQRSSPAGPEEALRNEVLAYLEDRGFRPARWLPAPDLQLKLRPRTEIASRLMGLAALFTWASAPDDAIPSDKLRNYIRQNRLRDAFTPDEAKILALSRKQARAEHADNIGWRLENMWPLAWVLGFEAEPDVAASQIDGSISQAILFDFLGGLDHGLNKVLQRAQPRSAEEVIRLEDRFYCAHNAVRSAQLGHETVPDDFHPVIHGGAIHERRHSLTWCLSPGVAWDDTDLST